jgi:hypothetical protein
MSKSEKEIVECPECGAPCYKTQWADLSPGFIYTGKRGPSPYDAGAERGAGAPPKKNPSPYDAGTKRGNR